MKQIIAAVFYLVLFSGTAFSQSKAIPQSWKLGTSTILLPDMTPATLAEVKQSGIDYLEIGWKGPLVSGTPAERLTFARTAYQDATRAGLVLWSTHIPYGKRLDISETDPEKRPAILAAVKEYIDLAVEMHVKQIVIHPSTEPIADEDRPKRIAACRESLKELAAYCKAKNASLALEGLPRTCLANTSKEILQILDGIDGVGVCFDSNHQLQEKPEEFAKAVGPLIRTLHISDYDAVNERHWMPGRGIINWNNVIAALIAAKYEGAFMYEVVKKEGDNITFKDLAPNYETLKKAWAAQ
ncbi:sugar phosphate isomerase/epimerase family protein [Chitinophaga barathri]|uniref:Sugar phosphate isomerase/epimerase n=1 Tax=Chitinophaga barathri TaxID=1647451 RepID=A0A3N4MF00_9BACT|nr:sugar phosphate isomerase/epimerase [Chitinophaga barathri]RPD42582.1 sugar phosphate isomerase/epimerase [Chitinophaga barathri]